MRYSLLPMKHYSIEYSIIWIGPKIYSIMEEYEEDVGELFSKFKMKSGLKLIDFDLFLLSIEYLFVLGKIEIFGNGVKK